MTLSRNERERVKENQDEYELSDEELQLVLQKPRLYNPLPGGNPKGEPCPSCDASDCIKAIHYVDEGVPIHAEDHPEVRNERASERR